MYLRCKATAVIVASSILSRILSLTGGPLSLEAVNLLGVGLHSLHAAGRKQTLQDHVFPCDLPYPQRVSLVNKVSYVYHIFISCCCYFEFSGFYHDVRYEPF